MQTAAQGGPRLASPRPRSRRWRSVRTSIPGWLFASPWIIGFIVFTVGPMLASIYLSFTAYDLMEPPHWIGLANFAQLFQDPLVGNSLRVTTIFSFVSVPVNLLFGLILALLVNQNIKFVQAWRTIYYLPAIVPSVATAMLWQWLMNGQYGVFNYVLKAGLGITGPDWLASSTWVIPAFIIMSFWGVGVPMVINLAGLQGIPSTLYEAASVDGANTWTKFVYVTLPLLSPIIFFNLIMGVIQSLQSFTIFYVLTAGGPNHASETVMLYLYNNAFQFLKMGYASALAWMLFFYIMLMTLIVFRSSSHFVYYESPSGQRGGEE